VTDRALSDPEERPIGERAVRGAFVTIGAQAIKIVVQLASVSVLARLLTPHDYGLLAMVMAVIGIGELFRDFGLSSAAIQAANLTRQQRSNLLWINSAIGLTLGLVVALCAPLIAALYGEPDLVPMARVLGLTFVINGIATQFRADLNRSMRFTRLAVADIVSPLVALLVAVAAAALLDAHEWALVAQQITQVACLAVLVIAGSGFRPLRPRSTPGMAHLVRFGWNLLGSQLIGYASNNTDSLLIGIRLGSVDLGLYNRSFQLVMTPLGQLRAPSNTVALPVLSRLRDDDRRYSDYLARGQLALGYTLVAGVALVLGAATPVTDVFLGDQWTGVTPLMRCLAVAGIFQTLAYVGYWVYLSRGLTRELFQYTLITSCIKVSCIVIGSFFGVLGVAVGYMIAPAIAWPLSFWWLSSKTSIPIRRLFQGAARILTMCALVAAAAFVAATLAAGLPALLCLTAAVLAGGVAYAAAALLLPPIRRDVSGLIVLGRGALRRRAVEGRGGVG